MDEMDAIQLLLLPAIAALGGVVVYLFKRQEGANTLTAKKLHDCEDAHAETQKDIVELNHKVGMLEGRQAGVESFATKVLDIVKMRARGGE